MLIAALPVAGCASAVSGPLIVSTSAPGASPASRMDEITSYSRVVATATALVRAELDLGELEASVEFYPNRRSLEAALLAHGYDSALARDTAEAMSAVGGSRMVIVNTGALIGWSWPERLSLFAHELVHTVQYELGGGRRGTSDQWLREGFAEWVAARVLVRLRVTTMDAVERMHRDELGAPRRPAPDLGELVTFRDWVGVQRSRPSVSIYALAFAAADYLIDRHGVAALLEYFRLFAHSQDRLANFEQAFGQSVPAFQAELIQALGRRPDVILDDPRAADGSP
jgi:hypothetical protein